MKASSIWNRDQSSETWTHSAVCLAIGGSCWVRILTFNPSAWIRWMGIYRKIKKNNLKSKPRREHSQIAFASPSFDKVGSCLARLVTCLATSRMLPTLALTNIILLALNLSRFTVISRFLWFIAFYLFAKVPPHISWCLFLSMPLLLK